MICLRHIDKQDPEQKDKRMYPELGNKTIVHLKLTHPSLAFSTPVSKWQGNEDRTEVHKFNQPVALLKKNSCNKKLTAGIKNTKGMISTHESSELGSS